MSRGDLLVAHTSIEHDGEELLASWFFTPGSPPIYSGPVEACDPGSGPELSYVEVDGMMNGSRDCEYQLRAVIGDAAFEDALERAMEVAERSWPDPDELYDRRRDEKLEAAWEGER